MNVIALHMVTTNDTNGNPRRAFVLLKPDGDIAAVVDEGYQGRGALDPFAKEYHIVEGPRFEITPAAYRDLRKDKRFVP